MEVDFEDKLMAILMELYDDQTGIRHEYKAAEEQPPTKDKTA